MAMTRSPPPSPSGGAAQLPPPPLPRQMSAARHSPPKTCKEEEEIEISVPRIYSNQKSPAVQHSATKFLIYSCLKRRNTYFNILNKIAKEYNNNTRVNSILKPRMYVSTILSRAPTSTYVGKQYISGTRIAQGRHNVTDRRYAYSYPHCRLFLVLKWHFKCHKRVIHGRKMALQGARMPYKDTGTCLHLND